MLRRRSESITVKKISRVYENKHWQLILLCSEHDYFNIDKDNGNIGEIVVWFIGDTEDYHPCRPYGRPWRQDICTIEVIPKWRPDVVVLVARNIKVLSLCSLTCDSVAS